MKKEKNWGSERFNYLPKITHQERKELRFQLYSPHSRDSSGFDLAKYQSNNQRYV